jgi:hypothetical protein
VARERKRQYVRASRSRYGGDQIVSSSSTGSVRTALCSDRTAPVSSSSEVRLRASPITAPSGRRPPSRARYAKASRASAIAAAAATTAMRVSDTERRLVSGGVGRLGKEFARPER